MCRRNFIYDDDFSEEDDPTGEYLDYSRVSEEDFSLFEREKVCAPPSKNVKVESPNVK